MLHVVNHAVQIRGGFLDIEILVLACPAFRRDDTAAVDLFEISIRELVSSLGFLVLLVVDPQMPLAVFFIPMLADKLVLFVGSWLMFAPVVPFVYNVLAGFD